jgi:hypothetical protein
MAAQADGYVQVPTDGSGKEIDHSVVTTSSGSSMYRQRIVLAKDDPVGGGLVDVDVNGLIGVRNSAERRARFLEQIGVTRRRNKLFGRRGL